MKALKRGPIKRASKRGLKRGYFRGLKNEPKNDIWSKNFFISEYELHFINKIYFLFNYINIIKIYWGAKKCSKKHEKWGFSRGASGTPWDKGGGKLGFLQKNWKKISYMKPDDPPRVNFIKSSKRGQKRGFFKGPKKGLKMTFFRVFSRFLKAC